MHSSNIVNQLIDEDLVHTIHTTESRSFRGCRRRWSWIFHDGYYPLTTPKPLEFGIAYHKAMEVWYDPTTWGIDRSVSQLLAIETFRSECNRQFDDFLRKTSQDRNSVDPEVTQDYKERIELGVGMLREYVGTSEKLDTGFKPLFVEKKFEVPITGPNGELIWCKCARCWMKWQASARGQQEMQLCRNSHQYPNFNIDEYRDACWQGLPVTHGGRIDMLAEDDLGRYWIFDWKTAARLSTGEPNAPDDYLFLDDQITRYCVPTSAEILTRSGWKTYDQLVVDEEVLGYSSEKDCLEWTKLEAVRLMGEQNVVSISNKSFSFTCTPDHKWVLIHPQWSTYKKKAELAPIRPGQQQTQVVLASTLDAPTLDITEDEAACLAWILTDGVLKRYSNGLQASIAQKKYTKEVQDLLDRLPDSYSRVTPNYGGTEGCYVWHLRLPFVRRLLQKACLTETLHGWESFITGLSSKARQAFNQAAMLAEGSGRTFCQNPGLKQDLFRLSFFLEGKFPSKGWESNVFNVGTPSKWLRTIQSVPTGREEVWCPQTSLGTWVMRQGSQIAITGNCWALQIQLGIEVAGFVYHEQKKAYPVEPEPMKVRRAGRLFSVNKNIDCDWETYERTVKDNDAVAYADGLYDDFIQYLKDSGGVFHKRHQIHRTWEELRNAGENIYLEALDMIGPDVRIYPSAGRFSCSFCAFQDPCLGKNRGDDYEYTLETMYEKHNRHYFQEPSTDKPDRG